MLNGELYASEQEMLPVRDGHQLSKRALTKDSEQKTESRRGGKEAGSV